MAAAPTSVVVPRSALGVLAARVDSAAVRLLAGLVAVSFGVRLVVGWLRTTPNDFTDEHLFTRLRCSSALLAAPLWLVVPELVAEACWRPTAAPKDDAA
ncbi:MAG: hypothetical protein ACJ750_12955 [Gaiellaceae bacterium]